MESKHLDYWLDYLTRHLLDAKKAAVEIEIWLDKQGVELTPDELPTSYEFFTDPINGYQKIKDAVRRK